MKNEWETICTSTYTETQFMDLDLGVRLFKEIVYDHRGDTVSVSITAIKIDTKEKQND